MVQKKVADQGLTNQIQGFKILGSYDASEKKNKEHDCIFFFPGLREASLSSWAIIICCVCVMKCTSSGGNFRGCEQNLCYYRVPPLTGHKCNGTNMATESGARYRD